MVGFIIFLYIIMWIISAVLMVFISHKFDRFFDDINVYEDQCTASILSLFWPIVDIFFIITLLCGIVVYYLENKTGGHCHARRNR
jgi:Na+/proline symporter